jgi:hypothetical protein
MRKIPRISLTFIYILICQSYYVESGIIVPVVVAVAQAGLEVLISHIVTPVSLDIRQDSCLIDIVNTPHYNKYTHWNRHLSFGNANIIKDQAFRDAFRRQTSYQADVPRTYVKIRSTGSNGYTNFGYNNNSKVIKSTEELHEFVIRLRSGKVMSSESSQIQESYQESINICIHISCPLSVLSHLHLKPHKTTDLFLGASFISIVSDHNCREDTFISIRSCAFYCTIGDIPCLRRCTSTTCTDPGETTERSESSSTCEEFDNTDKIGYLQEHID